MHARENARHRCLIQLWSIHDSRVDEVVKRRIVLKRIWLEGLCRRGVNEIDIVVKAGCIANRRVHLKSRGHHAKAILTAHSIIVLVVWHIEVDAIDRQPDLLAKQFVFMARSLQILCFVGQARVVHSLGDVDADGVLGRG